MTQENKDLLFKDLSARLPYGVKIMFSHNGFRWDWEQTLNDIQKRDDGEYVVNGWGIHGIKPYLRPMSSMTKEEDKEWQYYKNAIVESCDERLEERISELHDWFAAHHFDFHGLIEKCLAIEVTKENNPYINN